MKFLTDWVHPLSHCEDSVMHLVKLTGVKITRSTLQKELTEHPDYPSLLSIMDVLKNNGVDNVAVRILIDDWGDELSCPFLAHAKGKGLNHGIFVVVRKMSKDNIEIYSPETKKTGILSWDNFRQMYKGVILAIEPNENAGEKDYHKNSINELQNSIMQTLAALALPVATIISCFLLAINQSVSNQPSLIIFSLLTLVGYVISVFLLWHEVDEYNPVLKQICQGGKKVNCPAILNSSAAKIFGISWSSVGFTYFTGMLLLMIIGGFNYPVIGTLLSFVNISAIPYIFFSIYYQWQVAKQWCLLCLAVQAILILQLATNLSGHFYGMIEFSNIHLNDYLSVFVIFLFVLIIILLLIPALQNAKSDRLKTMELQRIKHDTQIFDALLTKNKHIELPGDGLTIKKGNPHGKFKLLKVCSPYCGPCAKAHPILEELLENNDELALEIIFTATEFENDRNRKPVMHLLAIAQANNSEITKKALNDWYYAPEKNYVLFAEKYPVEKEILAFQAEKIKRMHDWCDAVEISSTPTFFINGYKLPEMYSVADLKYFFTA